MTNQRTRVDVLSLEDFHSTFTARLAEIEGVLTKLNTKLQHRPPALGTFTDATAKASDYLALRETYAARAARLKDAIVTARDATATIIANYRTTEARNRANAADIASALGGVNDALKGGRTDV